MSYIKIHSSCIFIFQFSLIVRLDDIGNLSIPDLTPNIEHYFVLNSNLCWRKNVMEERNLSKQIISGAQDPNYCALLALGIYLVIAIETDSVKGNGTLFDLKKALFNSFFLQYSSRCSVP